MDINEIIANTQDGILVINNKGVIEYQNKAFADILGINIYKGDKYIDVMRQSESDKNDPFHQIILDSVYSSGTTVKETPVFYKSDGTKLYLKVSAKRNNDFVIFTISDVTEIEENRIHNKDASLIVASVIAFLCVWIYFVKLWSQFIDPNGDKSFIVTYILLLFGMFLVLFGIKNTTKLKLKNMGIKISNKKVIIQDCLIALTFFGFMCILKLILLKMKPALFKTDSFFNWGFFLTFKGSMYPISVIGQEFLARGFMGEAFNTVFEGPNKKFYSLLISSLFFGALHIHRKLSYMIVTPIFMFICGLIYEKQESIWGICIIHYALLAGAKVLGYM